jgi:hypothetical protein
MWAAGPPNAIVPRRRKEMAISLNSPRRADVAVRVTRPEKRGLSRENLRPAIMQSHERRYAAIHDGQPSSTTHGCRSPRPAYFRYHCYSPLVSPKYLIADAITRRTQDTGRRKSVELQNNLSDPAQWRPSSKFGISLPARWRSSLFGEGQLTSRKERRSWIH